MRRPPQFKQNVESVACSTFLRKCFLSFTPKYVTCVRFFPKIIWDHAKGFDESLTGPEDWDFDKKVRMLGKTGIIRSPLYHNESDFNLKEYLKNKSYYAKSFDKYINKWGKDDPDIKKQFGIWYRFFGVYIEQGKWKKILSNPKLVGGIYLLSLYTGFIYLKGK